MRVEAVAIGRFAMVDGRHGDMPQTVAEIAANFRPATVPFLTRHRGLWIGTVDTLTVEYLDLRLTGSVSDYPDVAQALRRGVGVSVEYAEGLPPRTDGGTWAGATPSAVAYPYFSGRIGLGMNLVGVALSLDGWKVAASGSIAWAVP